METVSEQSIASQMIRLIAPFPCAGTGDGDFELEVQREISEVSYGLIVKHIEFRRKCMNQGFDNLLELLQMHRSVIESAEETKAKEADPC